MVLDKLKKLVDNSDKIFNLVLLVVIAAVCFVWAVEETLEVIFDYDRYGYITSILALAACFGLSTFAKKARIARIATFIYLTSYLLFLLVITFLQAANTGNIYTMASTLLWVPLIYLVSFLFLSNKQAIISAIFIYCLMLVLLYLAHADVFELKNTVLQALLLNAALSQGVCIFCLFGVIKLKMTKDASDLHAQKMEKAANIDGLLGIGNRRMLQHQLNTVVTSYSAVSLLLVDVDHFKIINDTHGHLVGDDILRELTECIQKSLRPQDTFGRWGGEEFLVIANGTELSSAETLAERIRHKVEQHDFTTVGPVTVSIGVAQFHCERSSSHTFAIADQALYEAKRAGRNRVVTASSDSDCIGS
ncbi:MAG: diguanylate cyclase [Paraglaciecola sp.]|uniref:GGDEF domain-containing protein n=1 Tax=Paraglaciecola sp. TaxID=1920173 RepID=UPI003296C57F